MQKGEFLTCVGDYLDDGGVLSVHSEMRIARLPGVDVTPIEPGDPLVDLLDSEFARIPNAPGDAGVPTNDLIIRTTDGRTRADFVERIVPENK